MNTYTLGYWKQYKDNYEPFEFETTAKSRSEAKEKLLQQESCAKLIAYLD